MECLWEHPKTYKHGLMSNGHQRYLCPECKQTFSKSFDTLYYYRHVNPEQSQQVLQAHSEGTSLRGISRISRLGYNTVVSLVRSTSVKAQLVHNNQVEQVATVHNNQVEQVATVHNNQVEQVATEELSADAPVVICAKKIEAVSSR